MQADHFRFFTSNHSRLVAATINTTMMLPNGCFIDEADVRAELFSYIETYCTPHLRHSPRNDKTPAQCETLFHSLN